MRIRLWKWPVMAAVALVTASPALALVTGFNASDDSPVLGESVDYWAVNDGKDGVQAYQWSHRCQMPPACSNGPWTLGPGGPTASAITMGWSTIGTQDIALVVSYYPKGNPPVAPPNSTIIRTFTPAEPTTVLVQNPGTPVPWGTNIDILFWFYANGRLLGDTIALTHVQERIERYGYWAGGPGAYQDSGWQEGNATEFYFEHAHIDDVKTATGNIMLGGNLFDEYYQTVRIGVLDCCNSFRYYESPRWKFQRWKNTTNGTWWIVGPL